MSDRTAPPRMSGSTSNSPTTREREEFRGTHRQDRDRPRERERERDRSRSRSPRRDRERDTYRDRDTRDGAGRYGDRERGGYQRSARDDDTIKRGVGDYRNPNRDYQDRSAPISPAARDYGDRGGYRGGSERGRGGYGYGGRGEYDYERDRPLDRRAIEEGRRRREEERAKGIVFTDGNEEDKKTVPTGPKRGVRAPREALGPNDPGYSGSQSPYPESRGSQHGDEEDGEEGGEEDAMAAMLGFGGFGSTKGKPVGQNIDGAADVKKQRTWRQYMNRRGGFNRPLDKMK